MRFHVYVLFGLILVGSAPLMAVELLTSEEQSFETGTTPGRWATFTWPDTRSGGFRPSPLNAPGEGANGEDVLLGSWSDSPSSGWGSNCLAIYDDEGGWDAFPDIGGVRITLDVVSGATYTVSGYIKFATDVVDTYNAAGGMSVDTDGGINPLAVDYGHNGTGSGVDHNEFDPERGLEDAAFNVGEWLWNETAWGNHDAGEWYGPPNITLDIQTTGDQMTIFLWGFAKFRSTGILFDGISVDGPPPPTPIPPSTVDGEWNAYR